MTGSARTTILLSIAIGALFAAAPRVHLLAGGRRSADTVQRRFPVSSGARLTIRNSRGDVSIETWTQPAIDVKAVKTADTADDLAAVPIDIAATADSVAISSRSPAGGHLPRIQVNYELRVPADTDLKLVEIGRGRVQVAGVSGRAAIRVENGAIRITGFAGSLDAMSTNGDIDAALVRATDGDTIKLETFNGDIRLRLPKAVAPHVEARTLNGSLTSDLPLKIEDPFGPRIAHDAAAPGAPFINLVSVSGDIRIARR